MLYFLIGSTEAFGVEALTMAKTMALDGRNSMIIKNLYNKV
jgi:hypothetical protein